MRHRLLCIAAAGLHIVVSAEVATAKQARAAIPTGQRAGYDGQWIIDASTSSFFCPVKRKQLVATVHGGRVVRLSGLPGAVTGSVDKDGGIQIHIRLYGVTAQVHGRVNGATGAGEWSANSMICGKGQWSATAAR